MFDRFDNPTRSLERQLPPGSVFNDQILNIDVPVDSSSGLVDLTTRAQLEALVNGTIDEKRNLPSAGLTYRPLDGLNLRLAYSQTVARPSFRELGYYVTVETGSDDLVVGNPQLDLSDVESVDARVEYVWGDFGDLAAISAFTKKIQNPIESIVLRDPTNNEINSGTYRTFFNNPNDADLWGLELEGRKALDFVGVSGLEYLSLAANFTWIDAEVKRSPFEIAQAAPFVGTLPGEDAEFDGLKEKRRLFSQPEWIANADISFDHPDWGTKLTLAVFAISDVLDAAGNATVPPVGSGSVFQLSLDRYVDSFYQFDLVGSQRFSMGKIPGEWTAKASIKNLTDSTRRLIYDTEQTIRKYAERSYKIGRDYSFSLTYDYHF
jgi:outer membrane receptor protein involved in Fe transport